MVILVGAGDWMKNYDNLVSPMLEDGLQVLIYEGVEDFICNWYDSNFSNFFQAALKHTVPSFIWPLFQGMFLH